MSEYTLKQKVGLSIYLNMEGKVEQELYDCGSGEPLATQKISLQELLDGYREFNTSNQEGLIVSEDLSTFRDEVEQLLINVTEMIIEGEENSGGV